MDKVVSILMSRDGMTREEAEELVETTREMIYEAEGSLEVDDIIMDNLGLEPDYIFDLI